MIRQFWSLQLYKKILIIVAGIALSYIICCSVLYFLDSNTFKGGTKFSGVQVENQTPESAAQQLQQQVNQTTLTIETDSAALSGNLADYGVTIDINALKSNLANQKLRYALLPYGYNKSFNVPIIIDDYALANYLHSIQLPPNAIAPMNASVRYSDGSVTIQPEQSGIGIDYQYVKSAIVKQLELTNILDSYSITAPYQAVDPLITAAQLNDKIDDINKVLSSSYSIASDGFESVNLSKETIAQSLSMNAAQDIIIPMQKSLDIVGVATVTFESKPISQLIYDYASTKPSRIIQTGKTGIQIANRQDLALELQSAINSKSDFKGVALQQQASYNTKQIPLADVGNSIMTYHIETWGSVVTPLHEFREKAAETLLHELGWSRGGVVFEEVERGGDFTLVLSEGTELARRYTPTCDAFYSCRVGKNVIINDSRWQNATPVWTNSLRDYQHLVINHEVGHLLGHDHYFCKNTGDPAPVMQQQSIDLRNCTFNSWPLEFEIESI